MLLTNYSVLIASSCHQVGVCGANNIFGYLQPHVMRNYYLNESGISEKDGFPTATQPPYSCVPPFKGGLLSSTTYIKSLGELSISSLSKGVNCESSIQGEGDLLASLSLIIQMACDILASGDLDGSISGKLEMAASLAASGDLEGSLGLIANMIATVDGDGDLESDARGKLYMEADITSSSELSPQSLAAAVWSALAASFNEVGTMGNKLNSAGSAGDPWGTILPNGYSGEQAGAIIDRLQSMINELHKLQGLNASYPMTVTQSQRVVDDITLQIDNVGDTQTTVTRVVL